MLLTEFASIIPFCRPARCRGALALSICFVQSLEIENEIWSLPRDIGLDCGVQLKKVKLDSKWTS